MVKCPSQRASALDCLSDTTWHNNLTDMVTTSLHATFQWADVAYHRPNGSIAWHILHDRFEVAPIAGKDLLDTYKSFALGAASFTNLVMQEMKDNFGSLGSDGHDNDDNDVTGGNEDLLGVLSSLFDTPVPVLKKRQSGTSSFDVFSSLLSSIQGNTGGLNSSLKTAVPGTNPIFPIVPYAMLESIDVTTEKNPAMAVLAIDFLQNFLAIPIYWCQSLLTIRGTVQGFGGIDVGEIVGNTGGELDRMVEAMKALIGIDEETMQRLRSETQPSKLAFAKLGYEVQVGRLSLIVYIVLSTSLLVACLVVLMLGSIARWAGDIPSTGPFAYYDDLTRLVACVEGRMLGEEDWRAAGFVTSTAEQMEELRPIRVHLEQAIVNWEESA
jgi:hypothetical protein